jgi:nucleoside-diphosphate-sugar epimerase
MTDERFLVTGAMGCIGAWVVYRLVREGVPVAVFDQSPDPRRIALLLAPEELARVTFIQGDITDGAALGKALDEQAITRLIHLAALQVPFCKADPVQGARVNVLGTVNVFEAVARRREAINRVVYASSAAVYDAADAAPGEQVAHGAIGQPMTLYGVYKQANEGLARVYRQDAGLSSIGLRPYIVYGVGRDQGLTSGPTKAMLAAAVGRPYHIPYGGRGAYQYTDDVAAAFIAAARATFDGAAIFNVPGQTVDMETMVQAIRAAAPEGGEKITWAAQGLPFPADYDSSPLERVIGPVPVKPLAEGVQQTVQKFSELAKAGKINPDVLLA